MAEKVVTKKYTLGGLNLVAPLDKADPNQALVCSNLVNHVEGGKTPRDGEKIVVGGTAPIYSIGYGMGKYSFPIADSNGLITEQIFFVGNGTNGNEGISVLKDYISFSIAYSETSGNYVSYSCQALVNGNIEVVLQKYNSSHVLLSTVSKEITNTTTFAQLETQLKTMTGIDAYSSLPTSVSDYSGIALGLEIGVTETIEHNHAISLHLKYIQNMPYLGGSSSGYLYDYGGIAQASALDHEIPFLAPSAVLNNCLHFSSGYTLLKYDGYCTYKNGIAPPASGGIAASSGAGSIPAGTYGCLVTYSIKDNQGNFIESDPYLLSNITLASSKNIEYSGILIDSFGGGGDGYGRWGAIFDNAGTETGTTLKVDGGAVDYFYLAVGNYVYFIDNSGVAHERQITAVTQGTALVQGTITISGSAVTVANNTAVSPIRVNYYRTKIGPSSYYYLEKTVPFVVSSATVFNPQSHTDSTLDSALGVRYVFPETSHACFPYGYANNVGSPIRGVATYRGSLCAGIGSRVYFSSVLAAEYFPEENWFDCTIGESDPISALYANEDYLFVFKEKAVYLVSGELTTGAFNVDLITSSVGCCSQASIQDIKGTLVWASSTGVYEFKTSVLEKGSPGKISGDIDPAFGETSINTPALPFATYPFARYSLTSAVFDSVNELYILQLCSPLDGSQIYAWDVKAKEWSTWTGNFHGGAVFSGSDRYFVSTESGVGYPPALRRSLISDDYTISNFIAGTGKVPYTYQSHFEILEEAAFLKSPIRAKLESIKNRNTRYALNGTGSLIFNCYKDYSLEGVDSTPSYSYKTITIGQTTPEREIAFRILPRKCESFSFGIKNTTGDSSLPPRPIVTGVEIQYKVPYAPKFKEPSA